MNERTPSFPGFENIVKPFRFESQPHEYRITALRECPTPEQMQDCDTPDKVADYWQRHVATHPYFNPECECLVVLILNTRRRVKGHYLVSIGTMDTLLVHPPNHAAGLATVQSLFCRWGLAPSPSPGAGLHASPGPRQRSRPHGLCFRCAGLYASRCLSNDGKDSSRHPSAFQSFTNWGVSKSGNSPWQNTFFFFSGGLKYRYTRPCFGFRSFSGSQPDSTRD